MQRRLLSMPVVVSATSTAGHDLHRLMVTKASNRAAVHGIKLPLGDVIDKDELEKEIMQKKEEKEKKREEIEKAVESKLSSESDTPSASAPAK